MHGSGRESRIYPIAHEVSQRLFRAGHRALPGAGRHYPRGIGGYLQPKLSEQWTPIQVKDGRYLKNREFVSIDANSKTVAYKDAKGEIRTVNYEKGEVARLAAGLARRWWLMKVDVEPFGRENMPVPADHMIRVSVS